MEWDRLRIFHTVATEGSFTKATEVLNISQSAISRQISLLEKELKTLLFRRSPQGLRLTQAGVLLNNTVTSVSGKIDLAKDNLTRLKTEISGHIRIVASHDLGMLWLPSKIQQFLNLHPDVRIELILQEDNKVNLKNMDIGIFSAPISLSGYTSINPISYQKHLYASQDYLNTYGIPLSFEDLDKHKLVLFSSENNNHYYSHSDWLLISGAKVTRMPFAVINNAYGLCEIIKNGAGIGLLDRDVAKKHGLIEVLADEKKPASYYHMCYPMHLKDVKRIQAFLTFLETKLQERF